MGACSFRPAPGVRGQHPRAAGAAFPRETPRPPPNIARKRGSFLNHTGNYRLSLWDAADRILMSGFNADNSKTDAALKAQADAISGLEDSVADMVDAIIMPISVATIASRNCELEHKGTPLKLLGGHGLAGRPLCRAEVAWSWSTACFTKSLAVSPLGIIPTWELALA